VIATLLTFRRVLEQHQLGETLMARVNAHLKASGVKVGAGTIVDATIIGACPRPKTVRSSAT
jgi:transposase, IS5 family